MSWRMGLGGVVTNAGKVRVVKFNFGIVKGFLVWLQRGVSDDDDDEWVGLVFVKMQSFPHVEDFFSLSILFVRFRSARYTTVSE